MTRVGVFGAGGRMGTLVCQAVTDDPELELVAAVDPLHEGIDVRSVTGVGTDLRISRGPEAFVDAGVEVAVDFTSLDAARSNVAWCASNGIHAVVGTSGFTASDYEGFANAFTRSNCVIAPNFALSAVLMIRLAELAAPFFDTVEIVEMHHDEKIDAPSGTALMTADRISAASDEWGADPTKTEIIDGARGAQTDGGVTIHSLRLRGAVAHHTVLFGAAGQALTIRQDSYDRSSFMPGVLLAIKQVPSSEGVTIGLDDLLGL